MPKCPPRGGFSSEGISRKAPGRNRAVKESFRRRPQSASVVKIAYVDSKRPRTDAFLKRGRLACLISSKMRP